MKVDASEQKPGPDAPGGERGGPLRSVVIGGSGQIGSWLLRVLEGQGHRAIGSYATFPFPGLVPLDAADPTATWVRRQATDVVFHPTGCTGVDGCERDPDRAYSANLEQPLNLARAAAEADARFVDFSTDYEFDGHDGPYAEDAPTNPLSVDGRAKRDAELAIERELGERQLTVRTSWVFGPERQGKNFAYQLLTRPAQGRPTVCPADQVSSPAYGPDVARTVVWLAEARHSRMFHVVGPELLDRVSFARTVARALGHDSTLVTGKPTAELGRGVPRPRNGGLATPRLDSLLAGAMRPLDQALEDFRRTLQDPRTAGWVRPVVGFPEAAGPESFSPRPTGA